MSLYRTLKSFALRNLPSPLLSAMQTVHYRRALRNFDERDEPDMAIVRRLVEPGTTVVDVGANVGIYTKLLSELVGPTGRVVSVEPIPETFRILSSNVRSFGLRNVKPVNAAASNADGMATMVIPDYPSGGQNHYEAAIVAAAGRSGAKSGVDVRTTTLDALLATEVRVSFLKIDVEGHEGSCIAGAETVLTTHKPALLIEVSGNPDAPSSGASQLVERLQLHGYSPWILDSAGIRPRRVGDRSVNYFFLTAAHVELTTPQADS